MLTKEKFDAMLANMFASEQPKFMIMGGYQAAILQVYRDFAGRNWRRIKREVRKADLRYKRAKPAP